VIHLLEVHVLLALSWPNHVHHQAARSWFGSIENSGWATCGVTESGFIRVSSNHRVTPDARTPAEAALLLHQICQRGAHSFISEDISLARDHEVMERLNVGSAHVTDTHLILIAGHMGWGFATFDRRAADMAKELDVDCVLLSA
jgi:toxin-antitoxin system PIN domain toxin